MDLFDIPALKMVVEFLYHHLKKMIFISLLPLYFATLIIFTLQRSENSTYNDEILKLEKEHGESMCNDNGNKRSSHDLSLH